MKKLKGYVFSRKFNGNLTPQKIQNIILRDYSLKKNYEKTWWNKRFVWKRNMIPPGGITNEPLI